MASAPYPSPTLMLKVVPGQQLLSGAHGKAFQQDFE
jgi:hypothetical protein